MENPPEGEAVELQIDHLEYESPSHAIVRAIAALGDERVTDLPPLHRSISADALNRLLRHANERDRSVFVALVYERYDVVAHGDGTLSVVDSDPTAESTR